MKEENYFKMIEKKETYKLLIEKINGLEKKLIKLFNLLLVIPLIYFLLKYSFITEIEIKSFKIDKISLLLSITPLLYSSIFLYSSFLEANKARIKVFIIEMEENDVYSNNTRYLLTSFNLFDEISNISELKKRNSKMMNLLVIFPFYLIMLLAPFSFWVYSLYYSLSYDGTFSLIASILAFSSIWIFLASIFNYYFIEKDIYKL
jgi:hypothetical protein|tara:strand:+ start:87 stop:698 length:612 start_codon:yes stop_codon:yes gene_type:complete